MRIITIAALSLSVALSAAQAQERPRQSEPQQRQQTQEIRKAPWKKGGKLPSPRKYADVKDYGARGLKAPPKGQRWVKVDGQYLLIAAATGAIISVASGR